MNISLTPELREFVTKKVDSGLYKSASEVVREGLRLLIGKEQQPGFRFNGLEELKEKLQVGIDQLDRGEGIPAEEIFAELAEMSKQRREKENG